MLLPVALVWSAVVFGFSDALSEEDAVVSMLQEESTTMPVGNHSLALWKSSVEALIASVVAVPDFGYHRIPGLILTTNSRKVPRVTSVGQCQDECNRRTICVARSWLTRLFCRAFV